MPVMKSISVDQIKSTRGGRPASEDSVNLFKYCTQALTDAMATGEAVDVTLEENERPANVKRAFDQAAEAMHVTTKYVTFEGGTRPYTVRSGKVVEEICHFAVKITAAKATEAAA